MADADRGNLRVGIFENRSSTAVPEVPCPRVIKIPVATFFSRPHLFLGDPGFQKPHVWCEEILSVPSRDADSGPPRPQPPSVAHLFRFLHHACPSEVTSMVSRPPQARRRAESTLSLDTLANGNFIPPAPLPTPECIAPICGTLSPFWSGVSLRSRSHMYSTPQLRKPPIGVPSSSNISRTRNHFSLLRAVLSGRQGVAITKYLVPLVEVAPSGPGRGPAARFGLPKFLV